MPRTPLARMVSRIAATHRAADALGLDARDVATMHPDAVRDGLSRRGFLTAAAAVGGATALAQVVGAGRPAWASTSRPRIAIIGAGISGLAAALELKDHGYASTVYEWNANRVGGRIWSNTDNWGGQVSEWGGELIDTGHATMQSLAARFGLPLDNLHDAEPTGSQPTYYFGGRYYTYAQAVQDFVPVWNAMQNYDLQRFDWPVTWDSYSIGGRQLSSYSLYDWIDTHVPGGHGSPMGKLLDVAYTIEYGADTKQQTCLAVIGLLGFPATDDAGNPSPGFQIFGVSDETFHIRGGNDQLPRAIATSLATGATPTTIQYSHQLTRLARNADGTQTLTFTDPVRGFKSIVTADHTILAIPLGVYQNGSLDYSLAGFDARKTAQLKAMGMGANSKLQLQFSSRLWNQTGRWPGRSTGESYSDVGYQATWDVTRGQAGPRGILVNYTGGAPARAYQAFQPGQSYGVQSNPAVAQAARTFLSQIEAVYPGLTSQWNGQTTLSQWSNSPFTGGSYSYWPVGYPHQYGGYEGVRQGNIHFAGEHCSTDFGGYMEGGATEGVRAADEVLGDLGVVV